jgi:hypothetical protein
MEPKLLRRRLFATCCLGFPALHVTAQEAPPRADRAPARDKRLSARVEIVAFEEGGRFLGAPDVRTFESEDHRNLASKFHSGVAEDIPYGAYRLEARLVAHTSDVGFVPVYGPRVTAVVGLAVGYEVPLYPMVLQGRVIGPAPPHRSFVKLTGIYNSRSMESAIGPDGDFSFAGVSHGSIVLLVVGEKGHSGESDPYDSVHRSAANHRNRAGLHDLLTMRDHLWTNKKQKGKKDQPGMAPFRQSNASATPTGV